MGDNSAERSGKAGLQPGDSPKGRFLGKGSSSSVYETTCNGKRLARKYFVGVPSEIFEQEASVLEGLPEHKNLVKTCSWAVDEEECSLLVEYVEEDLPSLLQKEGDCAQPLDLPEALDRILQIAMGVECLHSKGVAHGGLKPKNIRVTHVQDGSGRNSKVVKVANHGLVRIKRNVSVQASVSERMYDIVRWKAPEQFAVLLKQVEDGASLKSDSQLESDFAADVYSFAVTCSQILNGNDPYPNLDWTSLVGKILYNKTRPSLPDQVYPQLRELLVSCWGEPANRPTFSEICERLKELKASLIPDIHEECEANVTTPDAETNGIAKPTVSSPEKPPAPRPPSVLKTKLNESKSLKSIVKGLRPDKAAQIGADYLISPLRTAVFAGFEILIECASNSPDGRNAVFSATCMRPPPASPENAIATAITILKRNRKDPEYCKYAMKLMVALTSVGGAGSDRGMINMEVATGLDLFISIMKEKAVTKTGLLAAEAIVNILVYKEVRKSARSQSGVVAAFFGFANVGDDYEPDFKRRARAVCLKGLQRLARRSEEAGFNETPETDHALEEGQRAQEIVAALLHLLRTGLGNQPELGSLVEDSLVALKDQLGEIDKVAPANHDAIRMMISKELSTLMVKGSFEAHTTVAGRMAIISMMSKLCGLYEVEKCPKDVVSAELERFKARFKIGGINELLKLLKNSDSKCQREFALIALRDLDVKPSAAQLPFESILGFLTEDGFEVKEAAAGLLDSIIKVNPADCANKFMENERAWEATLSLLDSDLNGPGGEKIASLLLGITAAIEKACVKIADHGVLGLDILVRYVRNHVNDTRKDEFEELLTATLVRFCKSGRACQKAVIQANGHVFLVTSLQDKEKKRVLREKTAQGLLEVLRNTEPTQAGSSVRDDDFATHAVRECEVYSVLGGDSGDMEQPVASPIQWQKERLLGSGAFGDVYVGSSIEEAGGFCAMKEALLDFNVNKESAKQLEEDISSLSKLKHENIVQYIGTEMLGDRLFIYLEYVSGGSIRSVLQERGAFKEHVIRNYTRQILSGLAYLHEQNTVHRRIKGANILLDATGVAKLADFGISKHIKSSFWSSGVYWTAPEVFTYIHGCQVGRGGGDYDLAVDVWSLGCTILEMATAKPPWHQYTEVAAIFKIGNSKELPQIPETLSGEGKEFVLSCLRWNPAHRPTAAQLLEHPFVQDDVDPLPSPLEEYFWEPKELDLDHRSMQTEIHLNDTQPNQAEGSSEHGSSINLSSHVSLSNCSVDVEQEIAPADRPKSSETCESLKELKAPLIPDIREEPGAANDLTLDPELSIGTNEVMNLAFEELFLATEHGPTVPRGAASCVMGSRHIEPTSLVLKLGPKQDLWEPKELALDHRSSQTKFHLEDTQPNQAEGSSEHGSRRNLSSHERFSESDDHDRPVQRQLSMLSSFSDFLLFLCIFLEPLSNVWTCLTDQGRLLISSLILWLQTHSFEGYAFPKRYKWRVNSRDLKTNRFLGQGCSGIVYETTWSGRGNLARKDFPGVESDVFEMEAARLVELGDFRYIVRSFCWTIDKQSCSLVMEYMRYDLYSVIQKRKGEQRIRRKHDFAPPFGLTQSIHLMFQIARGLSYLHDQGIAHGDLKPSNVLVSSEASPMSVKVADFGLIQTKRRSTTLVSYRARCLQTVKWKAPELFEGYLESLTVDNLWTRQHTSSPEASVNVDVFSDDRIMRAADVYSFGLMCSHILGVQNWDPNLSWMELRKLVSSGLRPQLPPECPSTLTSVIASCWAADPQARPSFLDIHRRLKSIWHHLL